MMAITGAKNRTISIRISAEIAEATRLVKVKDDVYVIQNVNNTVADIGQFGGNVTIYLTDAGALLVDSKNERMHDDIVAKVKTLTDKPISYVVLSHNHGDHAPPQAEVDGRVEVADRADVERGQHEQQRGDGGQRAAHHRHAEQGDVLGDDRAAQVATAYADHPQRRDLVRPPAQLDDRQREHAEEGEHEGEHAHQEEDPPAEREGVRAEILELLGLGTTVGQADALLAHLVEHGLRGARRHHQVGDRDVGRLVAVLAQRGRQVGETAVVADHGQRLRPSRQLHRGADSVHGGPVDGVGRVPGDKIQVGRLGGHDRRRHGQVGRGEPDDDRLAADLQRESVRAGVDAHG